MVVVVYLPENMCLHLVNKDQLSIRSTLVTVVTDSCDDFLLILKLSSVALSHRQTRTIYLNC